MPTTWDAANKSSLITLSNGDLTATMNTPSGSTRAGVRSTTSKAGGKFYFEIGITARDASSGWNAGVGNASQSATAAIGTTLNSIAGNASTGAASAVFFNSSNRGASGILVADTVAEYAIDLTNLLWWSRGNVTGLWNNGVANPAAGTGGLTFPGYSGPSFIWFNAFGNTPADVAVLNVGNSAFAGTVPAGFMPWDVAVSNPSSFFFGV